MADIIVGEKIVSKRKEIGTIVSCDEQYITVDFNSRVATFQCDAFEQGFLRYENADLQNKVAESIAQAKIAEERKAEERRIAEEKAAEERKSAAIKKPDMSSEIRFESVTLRLDPAPVTFNLVRKKDKDLIQEIFAECDRETGALYASFNPAMEYPRYTSHSRSKYCVGFLSKYLDTYVFRVFSRNDVYKKRVRSGVTVMTSDTTEVLRVLRVNGKVYYFSKNISFSDGRINNSTSYNNWHVSDLASKVMLNETVKNCDCEYLNDFIAGKNLNIQSYMYVDLLFLALHNNKAEIAFKNKAFSSAYRIDNIVAYLEEFTAKQIDFASKNNVLNTLPIIKRYGISDVDVLHALEALMRKRRLGSSTYKSLEWHLQRLGFDCSDLGKRLIAFVKKVDHFDAAVYNDYVCELTLCPNVTIRDFFDRNYIERHNTLQRERMARYERERTGLAGRRIENEKKENEKKENDEYCQIAKELSWIDREANGYFITIPKTIKDFRDEGNMQHNCVYGCRYFARVIARQSIVVFLRQEKNTSYVTIEFDYETFEVLQALGKYNQKIEPDLFAYIVELGKRLCYEMHSHH